MEKSTKRSIEIGSTVTINATSVQLAMQPVFGWLSTKGVTLDPTIQILVAGGISGLLQIVWYKSKKLIGKK